MSDPPTPATGARQWLIQAVTVFRKDWTAELRTRHALNAVLLFAVTTLLTVSLALGPLGVGEEAGPVLAAVLWIILLFAAAASLPRSFAHEEETHTATALRLAATPSAVLVGKLFFATALLGVVEAIVTPLFLAIMQISVAQAGLLVLTLVAGGLGLAVASVLIAAIVARARARTALFPILAFPVLIPLLLLAVELTASAISGEPVVGPIVELLLYDASLVVASLMLFPFVWNP